MRRCGCVGGLQVERQIDSLLKSVPNLLDDRVPDGEDETDNPVVRCGTPSVSRWCWRPGRWC